MSLRAGVVVVGGDGCSSSSLPLLPPEGLTGRKRQHSLQQLHQAASCCPVTDETEERDFDFDSSEQPAPPPPPRDDGLSSSSSAAPMPDSDVPSALLKNAAIGRRRSASPLSTLGPIFITPTAARHACQSPPRKRLWSGDINFIRRGHQSPPSSPSSGGGGLMRGTGAGGGASSPNQKTRKVQQQSPDDAADGIVVKMEEEPVMNALPLVFRSGHVPLVALARATMICSRFRNALAECELMDFRELPRVRLPPHPGASSSSVRYGRRALTTQAVVGFLRRCPLVKHINMRGVLTGAPASPGGGGGGGSLASIAAGLAGLPECTRHIRVFDAASNRSGDDGIAAVAELVRSGALPALRVIELSENDRALAAAPWCALFAAIGAGAGRLSVVRLCYNRLDDESGRAVAQAVASGGCPELAELSLTGNSLGDATLVSLAEALRVRRPRHGASAPSSPKLEVLCFSENPGIGAAGVKAIARALLDGACPRLSVLRLADTRGCAEDGLQAISDALGAVRLTHLDIEDSGVDEAGLRALAKSLQLLRPTAGNWRQGEGGGGKEMVGWSLLRMDVGLNGKGVGSAGMATLCSAIGVGALRGLRRLDVSGNDAWSGVAMLGTALSQGHNRRLAFLDTASNFAGDRGVAALTCALQRGACPKLQHLDVQFNLAGRQGAAAIAGLLSSGQCPDLTTVLMGTNMIGSDGATVLASALRSCPSSAALCRIELQHNNICKKGMRELAKALLEGHCPQLRDCNLWDNRLAFADVEALMEVLRARCCPRLALGSQDADEELPVVALEDTY